MTPDFLITADSKDITAVIRDRLLELRVTDVSGVDSDTVEIRLDDRAPEIEIPRTGAKLDISIGYRESGLEKLGLYVVDEIGLSGPPDTLVINARATDLRQEFKEPRTRSFDNITIGDLVATIAAAHGYKPRVAPALAGVSLIHLDQTEESDLNLLTRIAKDRGAVAKAAADKLLFVPQGEVKSYSDQDLPTVTKCRQDLTRWNLTLAERNKFLAVKARYRDLAAAEDKTVQVGNGTPVFTLRGSYPDAAAAKASAKAKLAAFERGTAKLSGSCPGDPTLFAEGGLQVEGVRVGVDGLWSLQQVVHVVNAGGYSCEFEGEMKP